MLKSPKLWDFMLFHMVTVVLFGRITFIDVTVHCLLCVVRYMRAKRQIGKRQVVHGQKRFEDMTETEAEVLAMLIDTEGWISISSPHLGKYIPVVGAGMTSMIPINMSKKWGGCIFKSIGRTPRGNSGRRFYVWHITKQDRERVFLEKIRPFLQVKQKQADVALQMLDVLENKPENMIDQLRMLRDEIRKLNDSELPDIDLTKL